MQKRILILVLSLSLLALLLLMGACKIVSEPDFAKMMQPVERYSVLQSDDYYTWGASPIKGLDGKYHLYYSRWKREYGFLAWVTHSEIAHAVSDNATGPYTFSDVALPSRGAEFWDGLCTHNPTIHLFNGRYHLYYMGNTGDGVNMKNGLNWTHRNNQRIGVATSDSPFGPWLRADKPLIDISADSTAYDALLTSNPSITQMTDGKYLMIYKAVGKQRKLPSGGPVVHLSATSDSPDSGFVKNNKPLFTAQGSDFPAEDPYIWQQDGRYYAIVKDMHGCFTNAGRSLALFTSQDGMDWHPAQNVLVGTPKINFADGRTIELQHLERPQLLIEDGKPTALFLAADTMSNYSKAGTSFNVHIKLK